MIICTNRDEPDIRFKRVPVTDSAFLPNTNSTRVIFVIICIRVRARDALLLPLCRAGCGALSVELSRCSTFAPRSFVNLVVLALSSLSRISSSILSVRTLFTQWPLLSVSCAAVGPCAPHRFSAFSVRLHKCKKQNLLRATKSPKSDCLSSPGPSLWL